jgi:ADP-ribose pyrophosphatase
LDNVTLSNGLTTDVHILRHPGAAVIVPIKAGNRVVLIKQYRHAIGGYIWEIPAGTLVPPESPLGCARRELVEETGYSAERWEKLAEILPAPGYSDERMYIFLASDLKAAEQNLDEDELLDVHEIEFDQAMAMIAGGKIQDAKTISGLLMAAGRLRKSGQQQGGVPFALT